MGAWAYDSNGPYEIAGRIAVAGGTIPRPTIRATSTTPAGIAGASFPNLIHATRNYATAQLNGFLYAFGGYNFTNNLPDGANFNQRYDATGPAPSATPTATGTPPTATNTRTPTSSTATGTSTRTLTPSPVPTVCGGVTEGFESGTLGTYTSSVAACDPGGCGWASVTTAFHSGTHSAFAPDLRRHHRPAPDQIGALAVPAGGGTLSFWHRWNLENGFDGAVLETSTNGGATWADAGALITANGYNGTISTGFGSPIAGRHAWTGNPNGTSFVQSRVNLASFAGQNLLIRFRTADDSSVAPAGGGWWVDDITATVSGGCATGTPATATTTRTPTTAASPPAPSRPPPRRRIRGRRRRSDALPGPVQRRAGGQHVL